MGRSKNTPVPSSVKLAAFQHGAGKRPAGSKLPTVAMAKKKPKVAKPDDTLVAVVSSSKKKKKAKQQQQQQHTKYLTEKQAQKAAEAARQEQEDREASNVSDSDDDYEEEEEEKEEFLGGSDIERPSDSEESAEEDEDELMEPKPRTAADLDTKRRVEGRRKARAALAAAEGKAPARKPASRATLHRREQRAIWHARNVMGHQVEVPDLNPNKAHAFTKLLLFQRGDITPENIPNVSSKFSVHLMQQAFIEMRDIVLPSACQSQLAHCSDRIQTDLDLQSLQTRTTLRSKAVDNAIEQYLVQSDRVGADSVALYRGLKAQIDADPVRVAAQAKEAATRKETRRRQEVESVIKPLQSKEAGGASLTSHESQLLRANLADRTTWQLAGLKRLQAISLKAQVAAVTNTQRINDDIPQLEERIVHLRSRDDTDAASAAHLTAKAREMHAAVEQERSFLRQDREEIAVERANVQNPGDGHSEHTLAESLAIVAEKTKRIREGMKSKDSLLRSAQVMDKRAARRLVVATEHEKSIRHKCMQLQESQAADVKRTATIKARQTIIGQLRRSLAEYKAAMED